MTPIHQAIRKYLSMNGIEQIEAIKKMDLFPERVLSILSQHERDKEFFGMIKVANEQDKFIELMGVSVTPPHHSSESVEEAAKLYLGKQYLDYGDLNEFAEQHILEAFKAGASFQPQGKASKTLQECKDEVAREYNHVNWDAMLKHIQNYLPVIDKACDLVAKLYASSSRSVTEGSQWISVIDRLPKFDELVIWRAMVTWNTQQPIRIFSDELSMEQETLEYGQQGYLLKSETDYIVCQHPNIREIADEFVTHWMPLPPSPNTK